MKNIKYKIILFYVAVIILCITHSLVIQAKPHDEDKILIIYDGIGKNTENESNLSALIKIVSQYKKSCFVTPLEDYHNELMNAFEFVIILSNQPIKHENYNMLLQDIKRTNRPIAYIGKGIKDVLKDMELQILEKRNTEITIETDQFTQGPFLVSYIELIEAFKGKQYGRIYNQFGETFPFAVYIKNLCYIPYFKKGNISEMLVAQVLKDYFSIKQSSEIYIVIKEIYPFSDLEMVCHMADLFYKNGIPFICSIMPVFNHTSYPAMQKYAQVLRYVQAKGGTIMIHSPVVRNIEVETQPLKLKMETFIETLANYKVVPLGVLAHGEWLGNPYYQENLFNLFSTGIVLSNDNNVVSYNNKAIYSFEHTIYGVPWNTLKSIETTKSINTSQFPLNVAIEFELFENNNILEKAVEELNEKWLSINDYKERMHTVKTSKILIRCYDDQVYVNDRLMNFEYNEEPLEIQFEVKNHPSISLEETFTIGNKVLVMIVAICLAIFAILTVIGIRLYRKKFIK